MRNRGMPLRQAIPSDSSAEVPPLARSWNALRRAAAYAGDSTIARVALKHVERDRLPVTPLRASPDPREAFLMGTLHDLSGVSNRGRGEEDGIASNCPYAFP